MFYSVFFHSSEIRVVYVRLGFLWLFLALNSSQAVVVAMCYCWLCNRWLKSYQFSYSSHNWVNICATIVKIL